MNEFWAQFFLLYESKQQAYNELADISYIIPVLLGFAFLLVVWWARFGSLFKTRANSNTQTNKMTKNSLNVNRNNLRMKAFGLIVLIILGVTLAIFLSKPLSGDKHYIGMGDYEYRHLPIYRALDENEQKIVNRVMAASHEVGAISKSKDIKSIYDLAKIKEFYKIDNIEQLEEIRADKQGKEWATQWLWFVIFLLPFASAILFG